MYKKTTVNIVMPVYNEERTLGAIIEEGAGAGMRRSIDNR